MRHESPRFGAIDYTPDQLIHFEEGLLGFPGYQGFLRLGPEDTAPIEYLLPIAQAQLSFPLLNPFLVRPDYSCELSSGDRSALQLDDDGSILIFCIATLRPSIQESTLNLLAPIVINPDRRLGRQIVLDGKEYGARESLAA